MSPLRRLSISYLEMRKALRNEIRLIERPENVIIQAGKSIDYEYCNNCNTTLEKGEYINRTFVRNGQGVMYESLCPFCYGKI